MWRRSVQERETVSTKTYKKTDSEWKGAERGKRTPECQERVGECGPNKNTEVGGSKTKKQISLVARIKRKW